MDDNWEIVKFYRTHHSIGHYICSDGHSIKLYYGNVLHTSKLIDVGVYVALVNHRQKLGIDCDSTKFHKEIMEFINVYQRELNFKKLNSEI